MSLRDARATPRIPHQTCPDSLLSETDGIAPAVRDALATLGYRLVPCSSIAHVNARLRMGRGYEGVSELRYAHTGAVGF